MYLHLHIRSQASSSLLQAVRNGRRYGYGHACYNGHARYNGRWWRRDSRGRYSDSSGNC